MIDLERSELANGVRFIAAPQRETKAVTVLFLVGVGSRFEAPEESGISHFLEHILFKGTKKYPSPLALAEVLDGIGANFNAYTSQEYTGFYVHAAANQFPLALDVLSEMFYHPRYAKEDIEREKGVIVEEINMYRDLPQRHVYDLLFTLMYGETPMGRNIAGSKKTVTKFSKQTFESYQERFYTPDNIIVCVAGNPEGGQWQRAVEGVFADKAGTLAHGFEAALDVQASPRVLVERRPTDQTHLLLGFPGLKETDERQAVLSVMNTILGGTMSSRLFTEIREQRGLAYYVRSGYDAFHDTGVMTVATGVRNDQAKEAVAVILSELEHLASSPVTAKELTRAKEHFKGKLALSLEGSAELCSFMAQHELYYKRQVQPEELVEQVEAVTAADIQDLATTLFAPRRRNLAVIGPFAEDDLAPLLEA